MWLKKLWYTLPPPPPNFFYIYPQGIQDVGDFVSSVEHKQRFLTQMDHLHS